jgi:tetratricopeptide (TPR) repeat protein
VTFAEIELGRCAWERGDYEGARARGAAALAQAEAAGHAHNRADALRLLADVARLQGDAEAAGARLEQAREVYQRLGERLRVAACLRDMASLARAHGALERAAALFTEARGEFEALGARHEAAMCLNGQGEVARFLGHLEAAEGCYLRAFEALRSLGARADAAIALTNLGQTALMAGDLEGAERRLRQAEGFAADREQPYLTLGLHLNLALLRARQGRWPQADRHLGAALEQSDRHRISDPDYARPLEALAALLESERGDALLAARLRERASQMWSQLGRR